MLSLWRWEIFEKTIVGKRECGCVLKLRKHFELRKLNVKRRKEPPFKKHSAAWLPLFWAVRMEDALSMAVALWLVEGKSLLLKEPSLTQMVWKNGFVRSYPTRLSFLRQSSVAVVGGRWRWQKQKSTLVQNHTKKSIPEKKRTFAELSSRRK